MTKTIKIIMVIRLALFLVFLPLHSYAAPPVYNGKMNQTISNLVKQKSIQRGFAANDPRYAATMEAISNVTTDAVVGGAAVATAAFVGGAPVWLGVGIGLGVTALMAGIYWFYFGEVPVKVNTDGTIQTVPYVAGASPPASAATWYNWFAANNKTQSSACTTRYYTADFGQYICVESINAGRALAEFAYSAYNDLTVIFPAERFKCLPTNSYLMCKAIGSHNDYPNVYFNDDGDYVLYLNVNPAFSNSTVTDLVNNQLSPNDLNSPADPNLVAKLANEAWKKAAQEPGYQGIPYDNSHPITSNDANTLREVDPTTYPRTGDVIARPAPSDNPTTEIPIPEPGEYTPPEGEEEPEDSITCGLPNTPPCIIEWGPQVTAPTDPTAKTAEDIGNTGLFADANLNALKGWTLPNHSSVCPTATFNAFNQEFVMDQQCAEFEKLREVVTPVMVVMWSILALVIILGA